MIKKYLLSVEMEGLPLLDSYLCRFERVIGEFVTLSIEDDARIILSANGELLYDVKGVRKGLSESLTIDAFLVGIQSFRESNLTRIPFRNGRIVEDQGEWKSYNDKIYAQVRESFSYGFLVSVGDSPAFMPMSTVPAQYRDSPAMIQGKLFTCEVLISDGENQPVVRPTGPFITDDEQLETERSGESAWGQSYTEMRVNSIGVIH